MDHFNLARSVGGREKWGLTYVEGTVNEEVYRDAVDSLFHPDDRRLWRRVEAQGWEDRNEGLGVDHGREEVVRGLANMLRGFDGGSTSVCDASARGGTLFFCSSDRPALAQIHLIFAFRRIPPRFLFPPPDRSLGGGAIGFANIEVMNQ